jgi:hypothetical protein
LAGSGKALPAGIDELERSMLEGFGESEEENDRSCLAAKAADVRAADFQPVARFGAVVGRWQCIIAASSAKMHRAGCLLIENGTIKEFWVVMMKDRKGEQRRADEFRGLPKVEQDAGSE